MHARLPPPLTCARAGERPDARIKQRLKAHANRVRDVVRAMAGGGERNEFRVEAMEAEKKERAHRGLAVDAKVPHAWRSGFANRARVVVTGAVKLLQDDAQRVGKLLAFLDRSEMECARQIVLHGVWDAKRFAEWAFTRVASEAVSPAVAPAAAAAEAVAAAAPV